MIIIELNQDLKCRRRTSLYHLVWLADRHLIIKIQQELNTQSRFEAHPGLSPAYLLPRAYKCFVKA